jgi:hypothetical protein
MAKLYNTGKHRWEHGQPVAWESWDRSPSRWLLGPCPACGSVTSSYGSKYSCHNDYCPNSADNFVCSPAPTPDWWETDIDVKLDGNAWCATGAGFVDLQESPAGFGDSPREAVADLRRQLAPEG